MFITYKHKFYHLNLIVIFLFASIINKNNSKSLASSGCKVSNLFEKGK